MRLHLESAAEDFPALLARLCKSWDLNPDRHCMSIAVIVNDLYPGRFELYGIGRPKVLHHYPVHVFFRDPKTKVVFDGNGPTTLAKLRKRWLSNFPTGIVERINPATHTQFTGNRSDMAKYSTRFKRALKEADPPTS